LLGGSTLSLLRESEQLEKDITNELYREYKALRIHLIKAIGDNNPGKDKLDIIRYAQTILDRILFIAFAEDKGLLPDKTLGRAFETVNPFDPQPIWKNFLGLFHAINVGNTKLNIPGYNGGLFAADADLHDLNISDELCEGFKKIGDYDFDSEVGVNILGHIFEQSISDLEELKSQAEDGADVPDNTKGKRKKDGIFYTPPYITRYIVEQAVGGWLADKRRGIGFDALPILTGSDYESIQVKKRKGQLRYNKAIEKHIKAWETYKEVLSNIKVLDPACGSGAFLNEVFDYLENEGQTINNELARLKGGQTSLFRWDKHILANNIFGVDVNRESIEITKLSLWLKTANKNEKLTYLENNIKAGNSLIGAPTIAGILAFDWHKEFPNIMAAGGFDVVVGNPPYGALLDKGALEYLKKEYNSYEYQVNTYVIFYERGITLLKNNGFLGFITPATFLYQHYFQKIRSLISSFKIKSIAKYNYPVFEDADIGDTVSFIVQKGDQQGESISLLLCNSKEDASQRHQLIDIGSFVNNDGTYRISSSGIPDKVFKNITLNDIAGVVVGIKAYQTGKGIPKQTKEIVASKPFTAFSAQGAPYKLCIVGSNFHRYRFLETPAMYLKYGEWLAEPRPDAPFFDEEKIILRQTADSIIAHLDCSRSINLNNVYNIGKKDCNYSLKYILGILNSRLMRKIYQSIAQEKGKLFAEVKKVYLSKLPIKNTSKAGREALERLVDAIMNKNNELAQIVLRFVNLAANEFSIPAKGVSNWLEVDFKHFTNAVEKQIKPRKLTLAQKSEWIQHFEAEKIKALALKAEVDRLDAEIDQMVYALYDLTPDEIASIEASE
jgi:type I restriction-modification system DNA methylase subunit